MMVVGGGLLGSPFSGGGGRALLVGYAAAAATTEGKKVLSTQCTRIGQNKRKGQTETSRRRRRRRALIIQFALSADGEVVTSSAAARTHSSWRCTPGASVHRRSFPISLGFWLLLRKLNAVNGRQVIL